MKLLASLLIFAFAGMAQASDYHLIYDWPSIDNTPINSLCLDGDNFRSTTAVSYCSQTQTVQYACPRPGYAEARPCRKLGPHDRATSDEIVKEDAICTAYGTEYKSYPRNYQVQECSKRAPDVWGLGECIEWTTLQKTYDATFRVSTYRLSMTDSGYEKIFAGYKKYTVPNCQ